ncbi:MAG TPA: DUF892 family protein [Sphingobacteriaceae bacterium]
MKKTINTVRDALAYQLKGLVDAETRVRDEFQNCLVQLTSPEVKLQIQDYVSAADNKLQKLDRVFSYLMEEPAPRKNEVIAKMIAETHHLLTLASPAPLKDVLMAGCVQNINAFKIASYRSAYLFAVELELDPVADLIQQILNWELSTAKRIASLPIHEFNRLNESTKAK